MTTKTKPHWSLSLVQKCACEEGIKWAQEQKTASAAWKNCQRGDWMLWLLGGIAGPVESESRKKLAYVACQCARLALPYTTDPRARECIETTERYTRGEATLQDVYKAAVAAYAAAIASAASAAIASAADAAVAAYAVDDDDAREKTLAQCADIVREHYPEPPELSIEAAGTIYRSRRGGRRER